MIEKGQEYLAVKPNLYGERIRIRVTGARQSWGSGYDRVPIVTVTESGREVRHRLISAAQLHQDLVNRNGKLHRSGYILVERES